MPNIIGLNAHQQLLQLNRQTKGSYLGSINSLEHFVTFQLMPNSAMHFEEELRVITAAQQIPLLSKIQFPIVQNVDCSVVIELSASTLSGADCLHQGLAAPELCSLVSRSDLDPLFIEGHSCLAKTPSYECSKHILPSKPSHHQNKLIFGGLARMLASRDILLVLRVVSAVTSCDEYWALVPPAAAPVARSVPYQTDSQSQLLQGLHIEEGALASHVVEMNTTCGTSLRGGEAEDCHMVLVRLVDRDELLMDGSLNATKDTTSHAHTRNRKHKADRSLEDSATGGTISSQVSLNEEGSDEGDGGAVAVDEEEDAAVMAETEEYLAQSLLESMGAPTRYNPLACPSGRINAVYDEQLRIKSGRHQPSGGSTAVPSQQYYPNLHQAAPQQVQSNYSAYQPAPAPITPAAYPLYQSPAYPPHHQQHQSAPQHQAQPLASYHPQNDFRGGCNPPQPQQQQQQQHQYAMPGYQQAQLQLVEQPKKPRKKAENTNTFQQHQQQQDAQSNQSCVPSYQKQQHNPTSGEEHYQQRAGYSNGGAPDKPLTGKGSRGGRGAYAGRRGGAGRGGSNGREEGGRGRAVNSDSDGVSVRVVPASRSLPGATNTSSGQTNEFEVAPISSLAPMQRKAAVLTDSGGPDEEDDDESIWEAAIRKKGPTASRTTAGFTSHSRDSAAAPPARLLKRKFFAPAPGVAGRVTVAEDWTGEDDISFTGGGF
eukprot:gene21328-27358_t